MDAEGDELLCVFNFTPVDHGAYPIHMPCRCTLERVMSSIERDEPLIPAEDEGDGCVLLIELKGYEAAYYRVKSC